MKNLVRIVCISLMAVAASSYAQAVELVVVDSKTCVYCAKFNREVGREYGSKAVAAKAPLRRVSAMKKWPSDLAGIKKTPFTPAFIVVDNGRELGRFYGYQNPETFYAELKSLVGG